MKKNQLALAIAGTMTAPVVAQADAVFYGSMRSQLRSAQPQYWDWRAVSRQMNRRER